MENQAPGQRNPSRTLATEPRLDPRLAEAFRIRDELMEERKPLPKTVNYEEALKFCASFEKMATTIHPMLWKAMPDFPTVAARQHYVTGVDGNEITLHIHEPLERSDALPCIVHIHGGGMVMMSAEDPNFVRWRNTLASLGMVVVGIEFRNGSGRLGNHPFPAGLNDCASGVQWVIAERERLNISSMVISGESGGGNLSISTTLKAKQEGWGDAIDGVYACCPYISGRYQSPPAELPSLRENDGYLLSLESMNIMATAYDPDGLGASNPLVWPLTASLDDLSGLPPHVISVNELDPLHDEGVAFLRKLYLARVPAVGRAVLGTAHASDVSMAATLPDVYLETAKSVYEFANSLAV